MVDRQLRPTKQRLLRRIVHAIGDVPPSVLTLAGFLAGLVAVAAAFQGATGSALAWWLLNRLVDGLDGEVARHWSRQSDLGGYLDLLADFTVYALLPLALTASHPMAAAWVALAWMLAAFYLNAGSWMLLSALLEKRRTAAATRRETTSVGMPAGLIEGTETALLITAFLLAPQHLAFLFGLTAVLVGVTAAQRTLWAARTLRSSKGMR